MDDTLLQQFITSTQNAIAEFDAGKLLDQRRQWPKTRAAGLAKWEKGRGGPGNQRDAGTRCAEGGTEESRRARK